MAVPSNWPQSIRAAGGFHAPITVFNDEPFSTTLTIKDVDYTGAAFSGSIRAAFEASSAILESFTFGTPALASGDTVVPVSISEADIEALRAAYDDDPGAIQTLFYNIKVTPSGGAKRTFFAGEFFLMGA